MDKKLSVENLKDALKNFKTEKDINKIQKDKILTLRKKRIKKNNARRVLEENEEKSDQKYKIYEFEEIDFPNIKSGTEIFNIPFEKIFKNNPYENDEIKYWLHLTYKLSMKGPKEEILKNLSKEKIKFLIDLLTEPFQINYTNDNNSIEFSQIKNDIKVKYEICSILINLLYDTNQYNGLFIEKMMSIYNFIITLIQIYENLKDFSFLVLITHYQWIINNCIAEDEVYSLIIKKNSNINFPELINKIFNINHEELYLNNIRMLILYLEQQSNPEIFFQYNIFILNIDNIISFSVQNNNIRLLLNAYNALNILLKSGANCLLVIENKQYVKLVTKIIYGFNNVSFCNCCLTKLIKNDKDNIINDTYQIYKTLLDIIFKKISADKDVIKHALKILRLIINNKNGFKIISYIISTYTKEIFIQLQQLYFEKPCNLLIESEVFNFLLTIFDFSTNSFKSTLINSGIHIFTLNCLEGSYQEFISDNKDNSSYNKLVAQILKLLIAILKFGQNDLNMKISLKNSCEEKNIYHILLELNYCKNKKIQDLIEELNTNFFEGYENEEYEDNEYNENNDEII